MMLTWISVGAALTLLLIYPLARGSKKDSNDKARALAVENEALQRTNSIYRERIAQLEDSLFSNNKYYEMAREIEKLSAANYSLRGKVRDLECLVDAERKRNSRERVEYLERNVEYLKKQLLHRFNDERETVMQNQNAIVPVEIIPATSEVAAALESSHFQNNEQNKKRKRKWSTIARSRKM